MRDPLDHLKAPYHTGLVATLTGIVWLSSAPACFLTAAVAASVRAGRTTVLFFAYAGALTLLLALDDLLMLHEVGFHVGFHHEMLIHGGYMAAAVGLLVLFRRAILQTDYSLLLSALALLALSLPADHIKPHIVFDISRDYARMMEDAPKLLGIVTWSAYFFITCAKQLTSFVATQRGLVATPEVKTVRARSVATAA